ncbi:MAG TPA: single-stranded DNA-binding protein [Spirochaetota bacterium]|nr:single-stranded DNA-binding protein [Spirochaetota bacterium]HQA53621.1 single-stranded DNA-binding protein [Spirochaetota bacterium]
MSDINNVFIVGRLTRKPDLKYTPLNTAVSSFTIANNKSYPSANGERKESVCFYNCVAWGKTGQTIAQYFEKGQKIIISGRLNQRSWTDKTGNNHSAVEIVVEDFQFGEKAKGSSSKIPQQSPEPESVPSFNDLPEGY